MNLFFHKELGRGNPVVLIHGFCETHEIWNGLDESLALHFKVLTPDLPGFGKSALPAHVTIDEVAKIMWRWIDSIGVKKTALIGHSLGGYVALAMAVQRPDSVEKLGLFHSTAAPDSEEKKANRDRVFAFVSQNGVAPYIETFVPGLFYKKQPEFLSKVGTIALKTSKETLLAYLMAMRDRPDRIPFLQKTNIPILILAGTFDSIIPLELLKDQGKIPSRAYFKELFSSGHMGMYEDVQESRVAIQTFLTSFGE